MKPVSFGVLGVSGFFMKKIGIPTAKSPLIQWNGIASRSLERSQQAADTYNITNAYGSYEELLADDTIEAVYIPLPNHMHAEWIKKAADAGKHVLCEKPLALTADEAQEGIDYATSKGMKVNNVDPNNIRNQSAKGGGALYDIGCYAVSASRFLMQSEPKRVVSQLTCHKDFETDILSSGILDFGNARAQFTVATQTFPYQRVDVHGSSGVISIDIPFNTPADVPVKVTVTTSVGTREVQLGPEDQYITEFEGFARAIREDTAVPTPPIDAIRNMKVLDALRESGRTNQWVSIS